MRKLCSIGWISFPLLQSNILDIFSFVLVLLTVICHWKCCLLTSSTWSPEVTLQQLNSDWISNLVSLCTGWTEAYGQQQHCADVDFHSVVSTLHSTLSLHWHAELHEGYIITAILWLCAAVSFVGSPKHSATFRMKSTCSGLWFAKFHFCPIQSMWGRAWVSL